MQQEEELKHSVPILDCGCNYDNGSRQALAVPGTIPAAWPTFNSLGLHHNPIM
jgi:hypothetical protein